MADGVEYYEAVAERMVPFLVGRKLAVEQRFRAGERPVYRRHEGRGADRRPIAVRDAADVVRWARQRAVAFHAHLKPEGPGAWFFLDIDSRDHSIEMARIGALHALDVVEAAGLRALVKFSGSDGFHLMWEMPDMRALARQDLWAFEREVVQAIADLVERRLATDPRAEPIRAAVGPDAPLVSTNSQLEDPRERAALLFDKLILKANANARVPYSLHPASGLASVPLDRAELERFDEAMAAPAAVAADQRRFELPRNDAAAVKRALAGWTNGAD
jgi:LigD, primase-polymerase domain